MIETKEIEDILIRLLEPNNEVIKQATDELTAAFKNPETFVKLCTLIGTCKNDKVKEYAAIVLRKKFVKRNSWMNLTLEVRQSIKQFLLKAIIEEPSIQVKKLILQLIAVLAKHEFMRSNWDELFAFIETYIKSNNVNERQFGMFVIKNLSDYVPEMFEPHLISFVNFFTTTLASAEDCTSPVVCDTISSMNNIIEISVQFPQAMQACSQSIPRVLEVILALSTTNPDQACDCYQLLGNMCEVSIQALIPYLKPIVQVSAQLAGNKDIDESLRCNGINLISTIIRSKKKVLVKLNLLQPIIELMFNILSEETDNDTWFLDEYALNPMNAAGDCMAAIADEISASTFMPIMIKLIDSAYTSQDPNALKASYMTMAFVSDGCSEYLKKSYLKQFVTAIKMGLNSSNETVKSAAMYALGEVSQYVQPTVSIYASEILPELLKMFKDKLLLEYTKPECSSEVRMIFYALDKFIDSMEGGIEEFLAEMVATVLDIIRNEQCCIELKDKAIMIMCSIVKSGGDAVAPYFIPVMEILNVYLVPGIDETLEPLQVMVIQLLSEFVDALDPKVFEPYLDASLKCGLTLLQESKEDQPEVRAVCYGLFSTVAKVSISHLAPYMDIVMKHVLKSLDNSLVADNSFNLEKKTFNAYSSDDDNGEDNDESLMTEDDGSDNDDNSDDNFVYMDAHVMEEKDNACRTIAQIAQITGEQFVPYLNNCFDVLSKLLEEDDDDTIDSVLEAYGKLCINLSNFTNNTSQETLEKALDKFFNYGEKKVTNDGLNNLDPIFLEVLADLLKEIKSKMIKYAEPIMILAKSILALKLGDENNPGELDELDSENNELPIEYAGNVVSNLSYVVPPQAFTEYFVSLMPLLKKLMSNSSSDILRSTGLAIIGESAKGLGTNASGLSEFMFSLIIPLVEDEDDCVRNNAVFALGEIAFYGKESMYKYYPTILSTFSQVVTKEQRSKVLDNIYGALARMIITNIEGVPLDHVIPVMINYLPLHEDFVENLTIFRCLVYLYEIGNQYMITLSEPVIKASLMTLNDKKKYCENEVKEEIIKLLRMYKRDFPDKCLSLSLPEDLCKLFGEI
ncbi:Armadillo-type fold,Armadillo-like helical,Importin-beta, N-terminal domain [Cinara cedri]|uniref:Armadillo-type fold,Armadillo-like helical,Importin-beta, N-terminal domain n=1 Tax=Cinara cedri TaxID=506608 RepID=A0A5E4M7R9_9HEMI|nr:Armadillo-type fold,Armadillo-like helical,Importin-beta, N-terminal domain [Cinara cedri]